VGGNRPDSSILGCGKGVSCVLCASYLFPLLREREPDVAINAEQAFSNRSLWEAHAAEQVGLTSEIVMRSFEDMPLSPAASVSSNYRLERADGELRLIIFLS
jgi:hypothetical protein